MPEIAYWLGLDVGTGGSRALLVDDRGVVEHSFTAPHEEIAMQHPLWAEQRPENWWDASQAAIRGVLHQAGVSGNAIRGVGLSGQMHGLTLLDEAGCVIRPALIWCDQRSQPQVDWVNKIAGAAFVLDQTANPMLTGFTLPKLLWVRDHDAASYARIRKVLLPKDYIRFELTGEYVSEVSDASGTGLFHVVRRDWSFDLADRVGVPRDWLPAIVESSQISGRISAKAASATGLVEGTSVAGGGGDQAASAIGNGIVDPEILSCTIGTSGVVFAHLAQPAYDELGRVHTFCHAVPQAWHAMGVTQGAGLSLQWFRNQLAPDASYDALTAEAAHAPVGSQGLYWLPYLMGERTPHLDPTARGGWIGLTAKHTRADLIRSLIEGVSYSQKDCLDLIAGLGTKPTIVRVSGGGARSAFWRQMLADVFNTQVAVLESQEGSAYGSALLAMTATGAYASVAEACASTVREVEVIDPGPAAAIYAEGHRTYQSLYPAIRGLV